MKALAFGDDLICTECFEKYLVTSNFPSILAAITKIKKVNSTNKCKECGKEYGCKANMDAAERLSKVLK